MRNSCIAGRNLARASAVVLVASIALAASGAADRIVIVPQRIELRDNFSRGQLLVSRANADGTTNERSADLTAAAQYESSNDRVVTVSPSGQLLAVGNGQATITVAAENGRLEVPV